MESPDQPLAAAADDLRLFPPACYNQQAAVRAGKTTIEHLPYELLLVILGFAMDEDTCHSPSTVNTTEAGSQQPHAAAAEALHSPCMQACLRSVSTTWRAATEHLVHSLRIHSWPCPFDLPSRFPNVQHMHLQQLQPAPDAKASASPLSRRHTRSQGPPPTTTIHQPPGTQAAARSLLATLKQLPRLHSVHVEQEWQGPVRGRAAQSMVALVVAGLTQLTSLTQIVLQGDGIIPPPSAASSGGGAVTELTHLTRLVVSGARLRTWPFPLSALPALHVLHAPGLPITAFPTFCCQQLSQLRSLDLKQCRLSHLPDALDSWSASLTHLDCSGNQLTSLPPSLGSLSKLQHLDCSDNKLASLPPSFTSLTELRGLNLSSNWQLTGAMLDVSLPAVMPHLTFMDLSATGMATLSCKPHMPALHVLLLSCNELSEVPGAVSGCKAIRTLSLDHNELTNLPTWLCTQLPALCSLDVSNNCLAALPNNIGSLAASLTTLSLSGNMLTTLPNTFGQLSRLIDLDLQENKLGPQVCEAVWQCCQLETLNIANNGITSLPTSLHNMRMLRWLDISDNELPTLPWATITPGEGSSSSWHEPAFNAATTAAVSCGPPTEKETGKETETVLPLAGTVCPDMSEATAIECSTHSADIIHAASNAHTAASCQPAATRYLPSQLQVLKLRGNCLQGSTQWLARATRAQAPRLVLCDLEDELLQSLLGDGADMALDWPLPLPLGALLPASGGGGVAAPPGNGLAAAAAGAKQLAGNSSMLP